MPSDEDPFDDYNVDHKIEPKTAVIPENNDLVSKLLSSVKEKRDIEDMDKGKELSDDVRMRRKPSSLRKQREEQRKREDDKFSLPNITPKGDRTPHSNITPRYLKEYRKKKEQGQKLREEIETNKSLRSQKSMKRSTKRSPSQSRKDASMSSHKQSKSVKRPHNLDYLNRLAQPKTQAKYVLVKEDTSSEGESEEKEEDEKQKKIREDREERRLYKKGIDFAQLISRESPRNNKEKVSFYTFTKVVIFFLHNRIGL